MDAAAAAQSKGLPSGWTASRNKGGRWTYVAPDGEEFSSLASAKTAAANNKKPPRVSEFREVGNDALETRGWFRNRLLKILTAFVLVSLGSIIGSLVGGVEIARNLFAG